MVGLKVIVTTALLPARMVSGAGGEKVKSAALAPDSPMAVTVSAAVPLLLIVTWIGALVKLTV